MGGELSLEREELPEDDEPESDSVSEAVESDETSKIIYYASFPFHELKKYIPESEEDDECRRLTFVRPV